jgi:hypothetical protein
MYTKQRYRLRNPTTGHDVIVEADEGEVYRDRETGERLEVLGRVLPLAPSVSRLPWAVENLRFCPNCDQLVEKDVTTCPTCAHPLDALVD